ncbi:hypothetical protein KVP09_09310 [Alcaligenaceae bacterium CGII-47]|nr:hypothetical protein [Alcaligenaceae bacterium CGII-47]
MLILRSLNELLDPIGGGPYISLYQPTHRHHPDNKQDLILFRNLVKQIEDSLSTQHPKASVATLLAPFHALAADSDFWNHTTEGIAVFGSDSFFRVTRLQRPTAELAIAADSFHIKPLLRVLQSAERFHVLSINRQTVRLFEGNRDHLDEADLAAEVPSTATDVVGEDSSAPVGTVRSVGGPGGAVPAGGAGAGGIRYSHGTKSAVIDQQTERFFREVDRTITEHHSKPTGLPLVLAALPEHHAMFRAVSHNAQLLAQGIEVNPDTLSLDELRVLAWAVIEPNYLQRLADFVDQFSAARNADQGSAELAEVAGAAVAGRVRVLLLEADRQIPGRIDMKTGAIQPEQQQDPQVDDMLDDLAEQVIRTGGEVIMVPALRMPVTTGLAAIYRF